MSDTIHLEGFSENLRGSRIFVAGSKPQFIRSVLGRLAADMSQRGKRVLVHQGPMPRWLQRLSWDALFHVNDNQDLKLALTFIQHMTKPGRVVWTGVPSQSVMAHLLKVDGLSLVAIGEVPGPEWQAIFWPPGAPIEDVEPVISSRLGPQGRLKSILSELRASDVGLVWSSIRESKGGALYWYDPSDAEAAQIDPEETAEILRGLADSLHRG